MARLGVAFAILINIVAALGGAVAQEAFHLDRLDVDIEVRNNGELWVTENHGYVFAGPTRSPRTHWLSTQDLDRIENVIVSDGNRVLEHEIDVGNRRIRIAWAHEPSPPERRTFTIKYTVIGGLILVDGDLSFAWRMIEEAREPRIGKVRVVIRLPVNAHAHFSKTTTYGWKPNKTGVDTGIATFTSRAEIPSDQRFWIDVSFPKELIDFIHPAESPRGDPTDLLTSFDEDPISFLSVAAMLIGLLLALIAVAARLRWTAWYPAHSGPVRAPPSDLPAPAVSMLETGAVREETVLSTIVEMARRGTISVVWIVNREKIAVPYLRAAKPSGRAWEVEFQKALPNEDQGVGSFHIPLLPDQFGEILGEILVNRGLFSVNPVLAWRDDSAERKWTSSFALTAVFLVCLGAIVWSINKDVEAGGFVLLIVFGGVVKLRRPIARWFSSIGRIRPTRIGKQEISAWRSFKKSLPRPGMMEPSAFSVPPSEAWLDRRRALLERTAAEFEDNLPYVVALGAYHQWLEFPRNAGVKAPRWLNRPSETYAGHLPLENFFQEMKIAFGFIKPDDD